MVMDGSSPNFTEDFNQTGNYTGNYNETEFHLGTAVAVGMTLCFIVMMTIGGNVLVLLAVYVNSHLRSTTNYFIVNLAIADLLLGTAVLPFSASKEVVKYWAFGQIFCDVWAAVDVLCCTASILSLCVISIDRYIGVTRPLQHSTIMTEKRALYINIVVWLLSATISLAPLIGWKEPPSEDPRDCNVTEQLGYVLFSVAGSFYIPLLIILVVYFRIYREAMIQSRFLATGIKTSKIDNDDSQKVTLRIHTGRVTGTTQTSPTTYQSSSSSSEGSGRKPINRQTLAGRVAKFKREKKAAKTLGIVVGVFVLCWFPFFFLLPLSVLCRSCHIPDMLFTVIFWLGYCNSLMNPIIYACSSREFKRAFFRILKCEFRRSARLFHDETCTTFTNTSSSIADLHRASKGHLDEFSSRNYTKNNNKAKTAKKSKKLTGKSNSAESMPLTLNSRARCSVDSPIQSLKVLQKHHRDAVSLNAINSNEKCEREDDSSDGDGSEFITRANSVRTQQSTVSLAINESSFADDEEYVNAVLIKRRKDKNANKTNSHKGSIPKIIVDDQTANINDQHLGKSLMVITQNANSMADDLRLDHL